MGLRQGSAGATMVQSFSEKVLKAHGGNNKQAGMWTGCNVGYKGCWKGRLDSHGGNQIIGVKKYCKKLPNKFIES